MLMNLLFRRYNANVFNFRTKPLVAYWREYQASKLIQCSYYKLSLIKIVSYTLHWIFQDGQEEERRKFTDKKTAASYGARSGEAQHSQELQRLKLQNEELTQKINRLKETLYEVRANAHYELKEKEGQIEKLTTLLEASKREIDDLSKQLVCSMVILCSIL